MADHPEVVTKLAEIGELIAEATPEERLLMGEVFERVIQTFALCGLDDGLVAARVLNRVIDVALLSNRDDRRAAERVSEGA